MTCDRCGCDHDDNDGELVRCQSCGQSFCDSCYGDLSFEWCRACRRAEQAEIRARARAVDGGQS